ncbi:GT4 family glycosyltransferase PelF [Deinococcus altitudinis]|uniref:GT4 family glycosyltransferase PelF n=1 Tax=Deinococcus altitudinis TaxID=468914 RepID=UPI0038926110
MKQLQIALLCEGTYPHMQGGVSIWCDQLIQGLPEHQFHVYAISGQRLRLHELQLPPNVGAIVSVPLWEQGGPARAHGLHSQGLARLDEAYDFLLGTLFSRTLADRGEPQRFLSALRDIFEYAQRGNLTRALTSQRNTVQFYQRWQKQAAIGVSEHRSGSMLPAPTLADAIQASAWLEHFLRPLSCVPPRVDVCHAASNGLSPLLAFASKWAHNTPFVLTEHGIYLRERFLELRFSSHSPAFRAFLLRFYSLLTRAAYSMADLITPGSHYNERWALDQGAEPERIRQVYNGINPAFFPTSTINPARPTISWVGRIDPLKDLETLIRAFGMVKESLPEAKLRMFGSVPKGNEGYAKYCQDLVAELGLSSSATFEGRVTDVVDAYHSGHMVALTSISEGFPYTLIEAMAAGRATVATDVGGVTEALGETGLVVPSRDVRAVAHASLRLLGSADLRHRLSHAARQRVLSQFTLENFLHVYREIYPRVLSQPVAHSRWQS